MNGAREPIMTALFARLSGAAFAAPVNGRTRFAKVSRRLVLWADVPKSQRPAMFMTEHMEIPAYRSENMPQVNTMNVDVYIYTDSSNKNLPGSVDLNVIMDAINAAMAPAYAEQGKCTLGGLVSHCRIEGSVFKDPGDLDGDGLLMIPLKIMAL